MLPISDEDLMRIALGEAEQAMQTGDVPVGAIVVNEAGNVIGTGRNRREIDRDPTGHAEIVAMRAAAARLGTWRLHGATLIVTKAGALRSLYLIGEDPRLNHRYVVTPGVLAGECARMLSAFFAALRSSPST